jgi:YVTN family beta-propeller protein
MGPALLSRRAFLLTPAAAALSCRRRRGTGYDGYAYVANEEGQAVAAVDLNSFTLARHIRLPGSPTVVASARDAVYALTPASGAVHEISPASLTLRRSIQVARTAVSMRASIDGSAIWVLCRQPRALARLDLTRLRVQTQIPLPLDPVDFDLSPAAEEAVVTFGEAGSVGLLDLARRECRLVELGRPLSLARFRSDGRQVLVGNAEQRLLSVVDVRMGRLVVHLPLAVQPRNFCFKSDGGQLLITGLGMDALVVVYPYTTEVAETVLAGREPGFMAECATGDTDYVFVTNPQSGQVTILDIDARKVVAVVAVGAGPAYVTPTPDGQYALVLNRDSGDMAVIRLAAIAAKRSRSAPLFTIVPVGSRPVSAVIRPV